MKAFLKGLLSRSRNSAVGGVPGPGRLLPPAGIVAAILLLLPLGGRAAEPNPQFSYVYAPVLGTGYYKAGDANIAVLRLPFSYDLSDNDSKLRQRLLLTASAGFSNVTLNTLTNQKVNRDLQTYSLLPGMGWDFQLQPDWRLRTYVQSGLAHDLASNQTAVLGASGIRSRRQWRLDGGWLTLGNGLLLAGQQVHGSNNRQGFVLFENGLDYAYPIGLHLLDRPLTASTFVLWRHFANNLAFAGIEGEQITLRNLYSIGVTLGFQKTVEWHHIPLSRVGISVVRGDNLKAISLNLGFPF